MGRKKNLDKLKDFKKELSKQIAIKKMILFGSRTTGRAGKYSDFDIILVSPAFRKKKSFERAVGLYKVWKLDYPVDFLCYTPEEFSQLSKRITLVKEAIENGIVI